MNVNILRYSLFGIAGGQEVDHTFVTFNIYSLTMIAFIDSNCNAEEDRNAFNNFSTNSSENDLSYFDFFHKSEYFDISSLNGAVRDQNLYLTHFNVRRIQKYVDEQAKLLTQLKALPDVLAVTKTKLKPDQVYTNINLEGFVATVRNTLE